MRILMVISQFAPIIGGTERQAKLLAGALTKKGLDIRIATGWWKFGTPHTETIDGIKIIRNFSCWRMFGIRGLRTLGAFIHMITLGIYLLRQRDTYDVIHVHQALYPAFISLLIGKRILKKPVLIKTASSGITSDILQLKRFPLGKLQLSYLVKEIDCLVTVSDAGGKEYQTIGFPQSKILNIPNGVGIPEIRKRNYDLMTNVLCTSRLSHEKGIDVLLQAWAIVSKRFPDLKLFILGQGPLELDLRTFSSSLGIDGSVFFPGAVSAVEKYLVKTDLFVLPSRTEGLSNSLLEAMSYGVPCIATQVGATPQVLGGEDDRWMPVGSFRTGRYGILVRSEDPEGLAKALLSLIEDERNRKEIGSAAKAHVAENYSIDSIAARYLEVYGSLIRQSVGVRDRESKETEQRASG